MFGSKSKANNHKTPTSNATPPGTNYKQPQNQINNKPKQYKHKSTTKTATNKIKISNQNKFKQLYNKQTKPSKQINPNKPTTNQTNKTSKLHKQNNPTKQPTTQLTETTNHKRNPKPTNPTKTQNINQT